jgi:heme o synthase
MRSTASYNVHIGQLLAERLRLYAQMGKLRLSSLVVFSAVMAFLFEGSSFTWLSLLWLSIGGLLVTVSANTINQIIEKETDKLMERTAQRPLPLGNLSMTEATLFAGLCGITGVAVLAYFFNPLSGLLGALSLLMYAFIYTPFKKLSPASVFIGAVPGAMPLLIGSTAAAGQVTSAGILMFSVQFLWQMPHFWAIAWLLNNDYAKAGFSLLPSGKGKSRDAALQNIPYLIALLLLSVLAYVLGFVGIYALVVSMICGVYFLYCGVQLCIDISDKSAKRLMFASFFYIPVVQIAFVLDRI